ncbi:hypothetical protein GQ457_11G002080 [Hibiscus cannabinus]
MILFVKASLDQLASIWLVLDGLFHVFGYKINLSKTKMFFSKNIPSATRQSISVGFGFAQIDDIGKYLGFPVPHLRITSTSY